MRVLSFYLGIHDSNLFLADTESGYVKYVKAERHFGVKRKYAELGFIKEICEAEKFKPDVVAYSDGDRNHLGSCPASDPIKILQTPPSNLFGAVEWINVDHHFAHAMALWPIRSIDETDVSVVIDGRGDHERRVSVYRDPHQMAPPIFTSTDYRIGHLFVRIGQRIGLSGLLDDHAGKLMGLQSYGKIDTAFINSIEPHAFAKTMYDDLQTVSDENGITFFDTDSSQFRDWLANFHKACELTILEVFDEHCEPNDRISYTGGCSLNSVFNSEINRRFNNLTIGPHGYDGGLSIGIFEAARRLLSLDEVVLEAFPFVQSDEDFGFASKDTVRKAAHLLKEGKIIGWLQGNGEIGPRALGHRSILMNPALKDGKERINAVKRREGWRPFAPSCLQSDKSRYTKYDFDMRYMLHAVPVETSAMEELYSCTHVDGTSRMQFIDGKSPQMETYEELVKEFENETGISAVLNTSYNLGGKPICSSREEANIFFRNSAIDVLVCGNEVIEK